MHEARHPLKNPLIPYILYTFLKLYIIVPFHLSSPAISNRVSITPKGFAVIALATRDRDDTRKLVYTFLSLNTFYNDLRE